MPKQGRRSIFGYRSLFLCVVLLLVGFLLIVGKQDAQIDQQREQLAGIASELRAESEREQRLLERLDAMKSRVFLEREVRRRFNLVRPDTLRFEAEEPLTPGTGPFFYPGGPEEAPSSDWANFGN